MNEISMQQLKGQRLTPAEKFVLGKVKGAKPSEPDEDGNIRWVDKDGKGLFKQVFSLGALYINYHSVWWVLETKHGLNNDEIQKLIKNVMYKYTNNGQLTPKFANLNQTTSYF